ncbi:MAG: ABC transporter permease [Actinobacteria bacterium]|nr:ABC transporter permease [Actinomycetota bacterium]
MDTLDPPATAPVAPSVAGSGSSSHPLLRFVARRVAAGVLLLLIISLLIFATTNILPGDVASAVLSRQATPESLAALREQLGLNRPLHEQYLDWATGLLTGDLGVSLAARRPVAELIGNRISNTVQMTFAVVVLLVPVSLALGLAAGVRAGRILDQSISTLTLWIIAIPEFVIGSVLVLVFAVYLQLLPSVSLVRPGESPLAEPRIIALPVATLVLAGAAYMTRIIRAGVAEVTASGYVEMARLNGIRERRVRIRYILRNALAPSVQAFAWTLQWLIGGVIIVETLFAYPGIGQTFVQAVQARDLTLVQSLGVLVAATYIAINIVADLVVAFLVPKLRTSL